MQHALALERFGKLAYLAVELARDDALVVGQRLVADVHVAQNEDLRTAGRVVVEY